jgi:simple sugar transport system permease protein
MAVASLLIITYRQSPLTVYRLMVARTLGDAYGFGQLLFRATPIMFTGLAVAMGLRAGLFNIGAEGQLIAGQFAAGALGALLPSGLPGSAAVGLCLLAAALAGGAVALVPGLLRARFGAHEVISTMMLNFIVVAVVNTAGAAGLFEHGTVHTAALPAAARLSSLGIPGSAVSTALLLAVLTAALVHVICFRSRWGFDTAAIGAAPEAARASGVPVARRLVNVMVLSGALAGLGASATVLGYKGYYEQGLGGGAGFLGIAVALLGRATPIGVVLAALVLAFVAQGTLSAGALMPKELGDVLQAAVILAVAAATARRR